MARSLPRTHRDRLTVSMEVSRLIVRPYVTETAPVAVANDENVLRFRSRRLPVGSRR